MARKISHIGEQAYHIWCKNVRYMLKVMNVSYTQFGDALGITRSGVSDMLNRDSHREKISLMQFHATMRILDIMIDELDLAMVDRLAARALWTEIVSWCERYGLRSKPDSKRSDVALQKEALGED